MKVLEGIALLLMLVVIGLGLYVIYLVVSPQEEIDYGNYIAQNPEIAISKGVQFYPRMRFPEREITYSIESRCSLEKKEEILEAFKILSSLTRLSFRNSTVNPRINFLCSEIAPDPEKESHFVAGEGGPTKIINTSNYFVILESKVSLYREDKCETPQIALHEILHAFGFDHSNNKDSIMFPITGCKQEIESFVIEEINELYEADAAPDIVIESITARQVGRYLSFEANISNSGLVDINEATLEVYSDGELVKTYELQKIEIGTKRIISVVNLRVGGKAKDLIFKAIPIEPSADYDIRNNEARISLPDEPD